MEITKIFDKCFRPCQVVKKSNMEYHEIMLDSDLDASIRTQKIYLIDFGLNY